MIPDPDPSPRDAPDAPVGPVGRVAPGDPDPGGVRVLPVPGIPEIRAGDDLGALLAAALAPEGPAPARDGDVLCVSSKIVSKARGLVVPVEGKARAVEAATVRLVARRRHGSVVTSVVETLAGPVLAGAGIDASNAPDGLLLLPEDPDAEAAALRRALGERLGVDVGVVLTDTSSRIWRTGVTDIALGASGVQVLEDLRGGVDDAGRPMGVTVRALGDELAAAADLVKGKTGRTPLAIVRGLPPGGSGSTRREPADAPTAAPADADRGGARALVRTGPSDWFRRPALEAVWQALELSPEAEPIAAMDPEPDAERLARAVQVAGAARAGTEDHAAAGAEGAEGDGAPPRVRRGPGPLDVEVAPGDADPASWARAGMMVERLRTAVAAEAIARPLPCDVRLVAPDHDGGTR